MQGAINKMLTIQAGDLNKIKWFVDASYGVHPNMKSHTGAVMVIREGLGAVYAMSNKQKLMTQSSTEAELVAMHNVLPQVIWTWNFMQEQGFDMGPSVVCQDNKSAILLEKNGRSSSSKQTRHIDVRYFLPKIKLMRVTL